MCVPMLYLKKKVMIGIVCFLAVIFLFFAFDDVVFSEVFIAVFSAHQCTELSEKTLIW